MSPCMAAMYGNPPNRYGFHCGIAPSFRNDSAPNNRNEYPAMNMSERPPPNSICPVRSGQSNSIAAPRHSAKASV